MPVSSLKAFTGEHTRKELQDKLNLTDREHFRKSYLQSALDEGLAGLTVPYKPNSNKQKYRLTEKGMLVKGSHKSEISECSMNIAYIIFPRLVHPASLF